MSDYREEKAISYENLIDRCKEHYKEKDNRELEAMAAAIIETMRERGNGVMWPSPRDGESFTVLSMSTEDIEKVLRRNSELKERCDMLQRDMTAMVERSLRRRVTEFAQAFEQHINHGPPKAPPENVVRLRAALIIEEAFEALEACCDVGDKQATTFNESHALMSVMRAKEILLATIRMVPIRVNMEAFADALADIDYVVEGARLAFGITGEPIMSEVHRANMAKVGGVIDENGKKRKPAGWIPPDIHAALVSQGWKPPIEKE